MEFVYGADTGVRPYNNAWYSDYMDHHRKSIRLGGYNYSENGYYFVTICVQNRWNIFGKIKNQKMILNDIGEMVFKIWNEIPNNYFGIKSDEFILMPDHLHGILVINKNNIVGVDPCVDPDKLGTIIKKFKTLTTKIYVDNIKQNDWPRFDKRLWQRNYFERIIRNEKEYLKIKEYIKTNPLNWQKD